jgi:chitinase
MVMLFAGSAWAQAPDQRPDHQCGPAFGNAKCGTDRCCSRFNWCGGLNEQHCASARGYNGQFDGPRSAAPIPAPPPPQDPTADQRPDHQCGPAFGNARCGENRCCSRFNWCGGLNEQHCTAARGYNGRFDGPRTVPDQRPDHQCGPAFGNAKCGTNRCCSRFNWCGGLNEPHCSSARGYNGQFDGPRQ